MTLVLAGCSGERIAMPPDQASPEEVVRVYANAVHAGDCQTASAPVTDSIQSACGRVDITAQQFTGPPPGTQPTESGDGSTMTRVWVERTLEGNEPPFPDGTRLWSYLLNRTGPNGAWRIYDQGLG